MTAHTKVGGAFKEVAAISCKVGGSWKEVTDGWTKIGGTWEKFYTAVQTIETPLGTPDYTYSQGDTTFGAAQVQALFAIDVDAFTTSTEGELFDQGATALGMGAYMVGDGTLRATCGDGQPWQNADSSYIDVNISLLAGSAGTFYFYADTGLTEDRLRVFWLEGGPASGNNPILVGNGQILTADATSIFGAAGGDIGLGTGSPDMGITTPIDYQGTINEARIWLDQDLPSGFDNPDPLPVPLNVEYLVVAGGGAGGSDGGGGGGAGGYRSSVAGESSGGGASAESALTLSPGTNYTVTIGAGGSAPATRYVQGSSGSNSVFHSITSTGGGLGGTDYSSYGDGATGGSGGGGGQLNHSGGSGTANQGYAGADAPSSEGGGGGGAGEAGNTDGASYGGDGVQTSIDGTPTYYAGGGGGGDGGSGPSTPGGDGGGGTGSSRNAEDNTAGATNTGGGGGGGGESGARTGAAGGSGIVILRYPSSYTISLTGVSGTTSTVGDNKVTIITSGSGTVSWS